MKNNLSCDYLICKKYKVNELQLIDQYYTLSPDLNNHQHSIIFGTSGHRGSSKRYSFNEAHILAISQSIVNIRKQNGITGPCYVGKDTHVLSEPAFISVLEVLTANSINVIVQKNNGYTPTPVISHAIVNYNKKKRHYSQSKADGIVITSSHNPPDDGGIKYSSIFGGPASIDITHLIEHHANKLLLNNLRQVNRITLNHAWRSGYIHVKDFVQDYVEDLSTIINMKAIKTSGLKLGVDPLSGSSISYWQNIAQYYQLNLTIIDDKVDRAFTFMRPDYDGYIRIDCTSQYTIPRAMRLSKNFDLFFVNDPDCDRHGIITSDGLMQSYDYFPVVANYLFRNRPLWFNHLFSIGKTYVSSIMINRVAFNLNCPILEVPVGFKWFSKGLFNSNLGFAGEESAGGSFLDYNGVPWSTDKDGLIMCLLAAEILAVANQTLQKHCVQIREDCGVSSYNNIKITINHIQKRFIVNTLFHQLKILELAGDPIIKIENITPYRKQISMDGIKITTNNGWIACRLSGTELLYKIYCESFLDIKHRRQMEKEITNIIYKIIN